MDLVAKPRSNAALIKLRCLKCSNRFKQVQRGSKGSKRFKGFKGFKEVQRVQIGSKGSYFDKLSILVPRVQKDEISFYFELLNPPRRKLLDVSL
jgi:hypothetical protein